MRLIFGSKVIKVEVLDEKGNIVIGDEMLTPDSPMRIVS